MASDTPRTALIRLHDTEHTTWRQIAALEEYRGIPAGTLCSISKGYEPQDPKIRRKLGLPIPVITYQGPDGKFVKR